MKFRARTRAGGETPVPDFQPSACPTNQTLYPYVRLVRVGSSPVGFRIVVPVEGRSALGGEDSRGSAARKQSLIKMIMQILCSTPDKPSRSGSHSRMATGVNNAPPRQVERLLT